VKAKTRVEKYSFARRSQFNLFLLYFSIKTFKKFNFGMGDGIFASPGDFLKFCILSINAINSSCNKTSVCCLCLCLFGRTTDDPATGAPRPITQ